MSTTGPRAVLIEGHVFLRGCERLGADQSARLGRQRRVDADEVALPHQLGERVGAAHADRELIAVRLVRIVEHHVHVEGLCAERRSGADPAHADDPICAHRQTPSEWIMRRAPVAL